MKKLLQLILKVLAKIIIAKYKPLIIGITGSIGKTSAKEAIASVMSVNYSVRSAQKNYNNEIGLPLVIIGTDSPGKSISGWFKVFSHSFCLIVLKKRYPQVLILEMGIDRPGDMDYLLSIVKLDVAVLTYIGSSHLANFKNKKRLIEEKMKIFKGLRKGGLAIANIDSDLVKQSIGIIKNRLITYGLSGIADVSAGEISYSSVKAGDINNLAGINFKILYQDAIIPVHLPSVVGVPAVYAALAATAVGLSKDIDGVAVSEALNKIEFPKGRTKLIPGLRDTVIIDDTYNAAPQSVQAALDIINEIRMANIGRKWVVLGDMLELGEETEKSHLDIGIKVGKMPRARLVYLGENAHYYGIGARKAGMAEDRIQFFNNHEEIIDYLKENIEPGDLILVKGSQGARMEKIVKAIMQNPQAAKDLLVRQSDDWL